MANSFARFITPYIIITCVVLFIFFHPFTLSFIRTIQKSETFKPVTLESSVRQKVTDPADTNTFSVSSNESPLVRLYLDIVRDTICGLTLQTQEKTVFPSIHIQPRPFNMKLRVAGEDWPFIGISMIGQKRLINLEWSLRFVISNNVPGDFIECGVWRGGGSVFARSVLKALDITDRHVWVVDSFQGLPKARTKHDNDRWSKQTYLMVPLEEVQTNFRAFNLLDNQVHFCKGYFVDSLPRCNVSKIAVLRMDGDMYESTMDQLFNLYSKIQVGGVIIVDDYTIQECYRAIHDFRNWHNITEEIMRIPGDKSGRYWIKNKMVAIQMDRYKPLLTQSKNST